MTNKAIDIGILFIEKQVFNNKYSDVFFKNEYLKLLDEYSYNKIELSMFSPYDTKEICDLYASVIKNKIQCENLNNEERFSLWINFNAISLMKKYFFLSPALYFDSEDFRNISKNSFLMNLYLGNIGYKEPYKFQIFEIKQGYESFLIPDYFTSSLIYELDKYNKNLFFKEVLSKYVSESNYIIIHKIL